METNPYQAPQTISPRSSAPEIATAIDIEKVRRVAKGQRQLQLLLLVQISLFITMILFSANSTSNSSTPVIIFGTVFITQAIVAIVLVYKAAKEVYNKFMSVILAFGVLTPFVGLMVILVVSQRATEYLRLHNIKVGFLGADPKDIG